MLKININDNKQFLVDVNQEVKVNDEVLDWDLQRLPNGSYSLIMNGKSYIALLENVDRQAKIIELSVSNQLYRLKIEEPIDQMLAKMGLDLSKMKKIEPIKAPMPGLILNILVTEGQVLTKGDPVLILEAMKMENVFKASGDAVVKSIKTSVGKAVEKGEILIELE